MKNFPLLIIVVEKQGNTNDLCYSRSTVAPTQHQKQQRMQLLHEQTWRVRYEQLSDQSNTTIQLLEEQSEKLREEVENLRRGEIPSPDRATGVNGDLNGTASTAMEAESAMPLHSDGMIV